VCGQFGSVLGADGAGTVVEAGSAANQHWVGKEVVINAGFNWGDNEQTPSDMFAILGTGFLEILVHRAL